MNDKKKIYDFTCAICGECSKTFYNNQKYCKDCYKERLLERHREYVKRNKLEEKKRFADWYKSPKGKAWMQKYMKLYYEAHSEKIKAQASKFYVENYKGKKGYRKKSHRQIVGGDT